MILSHIHTEVLSAEEEQSQLFKELRDINKGEKLIKKIFFSKHKISH